MPVAAKDVTEEKSPYSINKVLFEEATSIKGQLRMVEARLEKMEEHRSEVSESVYLKVKTDYETQIDSIRRAFEEKCKDIENDLRTLYQAQAQQEEQLTKHQDILEEAKFRYKLGEYNDKKFKELESKQNKEIQSYTEVLDLIKGSIKQYEEVLGHPFEDFTPPPPSRRENLEKTGKVETAPPVLEGKAREETQTSSTKPSSPKVTIEEDTLKTSVAPEVPKEVPKAALPPLAANAENVGFEEKLSDDLDMFLGSEGDYFSQESDALLSESVNLDQEAAPTPSAPASQAEAKVSSSASSAAKPVSAEAKGLDDSLSSILRNIPMEMEEEPSEVSTTANVESTGAHIDVGVMGGEASLLLIEGDLDDPEIVLSENTSIGRSPSNDIVLKESKVSRQHATIHLRNGDYVLVDLKSSNGVFVNGKKVEEAALKDGDEVSVGSFKFQFNLV